MERDGFVVLRDVLPAATLAALRSECDALCDALAAAGAEPDDEAEACVLDVFRASPPPERSPARTQRQAYIAARRAAIERACGGDADALAARHAAVEDALFRLLPAAVRRSRCLGDATQLLAFNEQYVVKPARSSCAFAWHRDGEEQLAMCGADAPPAPYVSAWCPLDDCGAHNGTLVVRPGLEPWTPPQDGSADGGLVINLEAGGACVFDSRLWHASGANGSGSARRVFYAQLSAEPLVCGRDRSPLAFAVPVG